MMTAFIPKVSLYLQHRYVAPLMALWLFRAYCDRRHILIPKRGMISLTGTFLFLGIYEFLGPLFSLFGHGTELTFGDLTNCFLIVFPLIIFHLSMSNGRVHELRLLVLFYFFCLTIAAVMTLLGYVDIEGGSRILAGASGEGANMEDVRAAREAGIGNYGHVYGSGLLIFPLFFCAKYMYMKIKFVSISLGLMLLVMIYKASFSILIIGVVLAGFLYLVTKVERKLVVLKTIGIVSIMVLIIAVANPSTITFLMTPLQYLSDQTGIVEYQTRLAAIVDSMAGNSESYSVYRSGLYWASWSTFLSHPFFGVGIFDYQHSITVDYIGGHSLIFDLLGTSGLFGFIIFILFFIFHFRYMQSMSSVVLGFKWWPAYYVFLFSASAIAILNPLGGYLIFSNFLFCIPSLVVFFKSKDLGTRGQWERGPPRQNRMPEIPAPHGLSR